MEIANELLRELHDYWDGKRAGRAMPSRSDIDPLDNSFTNSMALTSKILPGPACKPFSKTRLPEDPFDLYYTYLS